jgi:hypothetical protein
MTQTVVTTSQTWRPLKLGAGGFMTKLDIADDGTLYASNDTYGLYALRPPYTDGWEQLFLSTRLPSRMVDYYWHDPLWSVGSYDARVKRDNSDIIYSVHSGFPIKSTDGGLTWVEKSTGFPLPSDPEFTNTLQSQMDANSATGRTSRIMGPFMAVDQHNANVVYLGNGYRLYRTVDGGDNWAACSGILDATNNYPGVSSVMVDPSSSLVGSGSTERRSRVMCWVHGRGWYQSTNGGDSFSLMGIGGPGYPDDAGETSSGNDDTGTAPRWSTMLPDGTVLCTPTSSAGYPLWRLKGGVWYEDGPTSCHYPTFDRSDPTRVVVQNNVLGFKECLDITAATPVWSDWKAPTILDDPDMTWQTYGDEMGFGVDSAIVELQSSPIEEDVFWAAGGTGVWRIYLPRNAAATGEATIQPFSKGIENMVGIQVRKFPGNPNIYKSCSDRGFFISANPEAYASRASTPWLGEASQGFPLRFGSDACNPNAVQSDMIACLMSGGDPYQHSCGLSYDQGETWEKLKLPPIPYVYPRGFNTINITSGSPTVSVICPGASIPNGSRITFTRASVVGNVDLSEKSYVTTSAGPASGEFTITYASNATSTVTGGGGNIEITQYHESNKFSVVNGSDTVTAVLAYDRDVLYIGNRINFYNVATIGGLDVNGEQTILTDGRSDGTITFKPGGTASSDATNGGGSNFGYRGNWPVGQTPPATHMAMSTETNWMIVGGGARIAPHWTDDAGETWTRSVFPSELDDAGWSWIYYQQRDILVSDPNVAGHFYAWHQNNDTGVTGIYRSTDGGENFVLRGATDFWTHSANTWNTQLLTVPGHAGHLFWCTGQLGNWAHLNEGGKALFSTDGGATWNFIGTTLGGSVPANSEIGSVQHLAIGGVKPGSSYPTIWMVANLNGTDEAAFGIYYCTNADPLTTGNWTWNRVEKYPAGWMDQTNSLWADPDSWHTCYMACSGSGYKYTTQDDVTKKTLRITT